MSELGHREELRAAVDAGQEVGPEYRDAVLDAYVERIEGRLASSERALKARRDHQKEMILGAMGISIPLLGIAAVFAGLAGIIVVCAALAVIAIAVSRST